MTIQPTYHWQFNERKGRSAKDAIAGAEARFHRTISWGGHGRIGSTVKFDSRESRIVFGPEVGQFGTSDFTVAFGIKILDTDGQDDLDIIGTRSVSGHGNWFSLRLRDQGKSLFFEVDEDSQGKNYARAKTEHLPSLVDQKWHHVALVRQGKTLKIYFDGTLVQTGRSRRGVANIKSNVDVKLGHYTRHTPTAQYEDLRIYHEALSDDEIQSLVPPVNRPLSAGEIELVAIDNAAVLLKQDVADLSRFSQEFKTLRVGPDTRVSLFKKANFNGVGQRVYADLPDIKQSRLEDFPASVRIRSAIGEPFTGKWLIKAPDGQFLSLFNAPFRRNIKSLLRTSPSRSSNALFKLQQKFKRSRIQLVHDTNQENPVFRLAPQAEAIPLFVEELQPLTGEFAIVNQAKDQWLEMGEENTFQWTDREENRAIFARVAKMADSENQVGELAPGEVALYQNVAYHGRTWILSDTEKDLSGEYPDLSVFQSLQDETSSIRLGPETGVTVFRASEFRDSLGEKPVPQFDRARRLDGRRSRRFRNIREKIREANERVLEAVQASLVEDIFENVPNLSDSQIGDDTISSLQIFRVVEPEDVFTSYTTKLSQDYRLVGNKLEEFSAYRTTLRFEPDAGEIEVSATDSTTIEVDGTTYEISETDSVTLTPNELNFVMITSEADGLNTPGLKIRTSEMAENEQVVIFPNQEAHQQIAELEDGALWNAKDAQGNLIVDRTTHSRAEVASVQNTIKRVTATVTYADKAPVAQAGGGSRVLSSERVVSGDAIAQPWELKFKPEPDEGERRQIQAQSAILRSRGLVAASVAANRPENGGIEEATVSEDDFARLLSQATSSEAAPISEPAGEDTQLPGGTGFGSARLVGGIKRLKIGRRIRNTFKKAKSVVVGAVKGVVHFVVKTATEVIDFVVDTVEKVGEFIEAVVEKVVNGIKKFIEFLQFLFDWGDILDTQRYLKKAINSSFDAAKQLAVDAKPHVKSFVDGLQEDVEDGMNQLVESLGGKPSEVEESEFKIPEALEWFLSKLMGGLRSSDSESGSEGSGDSPLASFVRQLLEAFEDAVGAGLKISQSVFDSIQALIKNPREPEAALIIIIEALRDAIILSLEAVENLALSLLDVVASIIDLFKVALNAEIRIPFISDLLDFIGVGKLTVLNLATMTLAIPVTLTAKLVTGRHLFDENIPVPLDVAQPAGTPLALSSAERSALTANAVVVDDNPTIANAEAEDEPDSRRDLRRDLAFTVITTMADTVNHLIAGILDLFDVPAFKLESASDREPTVLDIDSLSEAFIEPLQALEIMSLGLSVYSWVFSYPALFHEPRDLTAEKLLETTLWRYRGATLALDLGVAMVNDFERMRRTEKKLNVSWALLSIIDMILASSYLAVLEEDNDRVRRATISGEFYSALPNVACFVRSLEIKEPVTATLVHLTHVGTNATAALVTATTGGILISEADKALKEAKAAT